MSSMDHRANRLLPMISISAFIVREHFGIETNAPNYLAHWSSPEKIKASTHRILACAEQIITACEQ